MTIVREFTLYSPVVVTCCGEVTQLTNQCSLGERIRMYLRTPHVLGQRRHVHIFESQGHRVKFGLGCQPHPREGQAGETI